MSGGELLGVFEELCCEGYGEVRRWLEGVWSRAMVVKLCVRELMF